MVTGPRTDLWQRTYYGFRVANAPALLWETGGNFSFTVTASFLYRKQFDQCGVMVYLDDNNWFKASIEHEEYAQVRLGSVVTNHGHSDWATTDIDTVHTLQYRLSRRGPDFLVEYALKGQAFQQMRIFHLAEVGDTTAEMGKAFPPLAAKAAVRFGVYACSPGESSFTAHFSRLSVTECSWQPHPA